MSAPLYNVDQEHNVKATTNFGAFRFDPRNRPINENHVEKLYDAIQKNNLLHAFPVVVDRDMTVLDGQHRIKAAEALGVPVYYIQTHKATIQDIASTNAAILRWRLEDQLNHWCRSEYPEYLKLEAFWVRHPWLSLNLAVKLCYRGDVVGLHHNFATGQYICNNTSSAERVVRMLFDFKEAGIEFWSHKSFVSAIANLADNVDYDHDKMMTKLEYLSTKMVKCPDARSYIEMINDIYNYRNQKQVVLKMIQSNDRRRRNKAK